MEITSSLAGALTPMDDETIVLDAAKGLTQATWQPRGTADDRDMGIARLVVIQAEGKIRYRMNGSDPNGSAGGGHILESGAYLSLAGRQQLTNFRAITHESEGSNAQLFVTYYR